MNHLNCLPLLSLLFSIQEELTNEKRLFVEWCCQPVIQSFCYRTKIIQDLKYRLQETSKQYKQFIIKFPIEL